MATIFPFAPIRPNPLFASQLVFTKPQTDSVSGDISKSGALQPLKTLLETGARRRPETTEGQQLAYSDIMESLKDLLESDHLLEDLTTGLFVYEITCVDYRQTGIWALTSLDDYSDGKIKIHELTFDDSVRRIKNYRKNTRLEGSPILLTYHPDTHINRLLTQAKFGKPGQIFRHEAGVHKIWKIEDLRVQDQLVNAFSKIQNVYLADGHHRLEAAAKLRNEQKESNRNTPETISSLYMATDQIRIESFHRVVLPILNVNKQTLFKRLTEDFHIQESTGNHPVSPVSQRCFGLLMEGQWYHLLAKTHLIAEQDKGELLDAELLQNAVLNPVFGIKDPKRDQTLKCAGGEKALEEIGAIVRSHPGAIAFTLSPVRIEELISAANQERILPPKATWVVPKVPYGILINRH